ncbi:MAG: hypothetical protein J6R29_02550 [Clostridia bacterium]|nr:hypothetical protein [Clostridia bacterium]
MVDMHSHVLPFVDDGSPSIEDSLKILELEKQNDVKKVIFTPHYKHNIYDTPFEELTGVYNNFVNEVKKRELNIDVYLGQEIYCTNKIYDLLKEGTISTINGTKCLLIEFNYYDEQDIADYVYNLKTMGYIPIIAHIERYIYLNWHNLFDLKQLGALLQVNASSITGEEGRTIRRRVLKAIKQGLVDFVSSDVHSDRQLPMKNAYKIVQKTAGTLIADNVFKNNAKKYFNL